MIGTMLGGWLAGGRGYYPTGRSHPYPTIITPAVTGKGYYRRSCAPDANFLVVNGKSGYFEYIVRPKRSKARQRASKARARLISRGKS